MKSQRTSTFALSALGTYKKCPTVEARLTIHLQRISMFLKVAQTVPSQTIIVEGSCLDGSNKLAIQLKNEGKFTLHLYRIGCRRHSVGGIPLFPKHTL